LESSDSDHLREFLYSKKHNVVAVALSHPAARHVLELRIAAVDSVDGKPMYFERSNYEVDGYVSEIYSLGLVSQLPSETLRVLDLTNCGGLKLPASATIAFPRLASLRLRHCNVPLDVLQAVIDAAPVLTVIHLESVPFVVEGKKLQSISLRCPTATALVLDKCLLNEEGTPVAIYAPMLRRFRYRGVLRHISLTPPPQLLARAELTLIEHGSVQERNPSIDREIFWGTVHGFIHAKELKLTVRHLEEIATTNGRRRVKLLPTLRRLERLELQGVHTPTGNRAAAAIANLLHCCPAWRDLRINLSTTHHDANKQDEYGLEFLERKYRSQLEESVHRFQRRRRTQPTTIAGDEHDDDVNYDEIPDLPDYMSGNSFECLRRCLRRVALQFRREGTDCFGSTKLIKFFAQHAKVLEELCIDAGNERIRDHMNLKIGKWIANSSKRRRIDATSAAKLQILSLTRSSN
jgi:hypothetical protein